MRDRTVGGGDIWQLFTKVALLHIAFVRLHCSVGWRRRRCVTLCQNSVRTSVRLYFVKVAGLKPSGGTCVFVSARQTCLMLPSCPCSHPLHCLPGSTVSSNKQIVPSAMPLRETPVLAAYFGRCTQTAVFNACMRVFESMCVCAPVVGMRMCVDTGQIKSASLTMCASPSNVPPAAA